MDENHSGGRRSNLSKRSVIPVIALVTLVGLCAAILIPVTIKASRERGRAEQNLLLIKIEIAFSVGIRAYFETLPDTLVPERVTKLVIDEMTKETAGTHLFGLQGQPLSYIAPGADPQPGTYTILFRELGSAWNDSQITESFQMEPTELPIDWFIALIIYGIRKTDRYKSPDIAMMDLNGDGLADPVHYIRLTTLSFEAWRPDPTAHGIVEIDNERRWLIREGYAGADKSVAEDLKLLLEANGL